MKTNEHSLAISDRQIRARCRDNEQAFTMVEIALSIAIVAFAMVAIIGVLPTGLQVQRDNREETIINQDGAYLLEAIRSGGLGLDDLTNFVERITITNRSGGWSISYFGSRLPEIGRQIPLTNGHFIIGMLSVPTYQHKGNYPRGRPVLSTNEVTALMRSISGSASQRFQSQEFRENAFTYLLTTTIAPYDPIVTNNIPSRISDPVAFNRLAMARNNVMSNLYDVRLHFRWPVNVSGAGEDMQYQVGKREQVFRSLVNGRLMPTNAFWFSNNHYSSTNLFYFQPSTFAPPAK